MGGGAHEPLVGAQGARLGVGLAQRRDGQGAAGRDVVLGGLDDQLGVGQDPSQDQAGGLEGAHGLARGGVQDQDGGTGVGDRRRVVRLELEGDVPAVGTDDDWTGSPAAMRARSCLLYTSPSPRD